MIRGWGAEEEAEVSNGGSRGDSGSVCVVRSMLRKRKFLSPIFEVAEVSVSKGIRQGTIIDQAEVSPDSKSSAKTGP